MVSRDSNLLIAKLRYITHIFKATASEKKNQTNNLGEVKTLNVTDLKFDFKMLRHMGHQTRPNSNQLSNVIILVCFSFQL